ncbi:MAG: lysine--tRNA ligase [Deltaproteobacteria bacterium CG_4_10_14_0_2_um_filter_43_8]|nr:MAG: lysine--tRNA ligase [Deltaproteobacteria bacterium CG11_big_fil_rev_8_21_14_0_20_42_23]PJA18976.1 MAG: lysine--tRNA ligase [Deltaproteobacteria bacterium CG_4_10_14_0_2_um_filter_43_8]PJC63744.1 MAG: lysine--tRNA ligase [Deltaproteobacteria bacterium CG_4_9_14_0_2_um_filter_42_21]
MTENENQYIEQRREKLSQYRESGTNPFPNGIQPQDLSREIFEQYERCSREELEGKTESFSLAGRIIATRLFGKAGFMRIRDRSGEIQFYTSKQDLSDAEFALFKSVEVGDFVFVSGKLFRTKTDELTLHASELKLVTKTIRPLPEKWHGLTDIETRYRQRYVDLIANQEVKATFVARSKIVQAIRNFLTDRDFLEVETPMMHSIPGGAAAKPFVTHHNTLDMELFLRIAPELYLKRLVVGGLERVFEINRNFRNEGISIQHNPEFTMLEFYQAYATFEDLMNLTEAMFAHVVKSVCGSEKVTYQDQEIQFGSPFKRLSMEDAIVEFAGIEREVLHERKKALTALEQLGGKPKAEHEGVGAIMAEIFELTCESKLIQPTFITHFPTEVSPLARRNDSNPEVTDRFELYIYGREIANGFSELNDPEDQAARFKAQVTALEGGNDEAMHYDSDYIRALEYGMPPTAGEGIGIDRLVMLLTNSPSIRDVILFPQMKKRDDV